MKTPCFSRRQSGVGMIEVLVALLVMSIGVLGYAGLQLRALRSTGDAHFRTQAVAIAQDVVERISVNPAGAAVYSTLGNWDQADMNRSQPAGWDTCYGQACTPNQIANWDVLQARWTAWMLLPQGRVAAVACPVGDRLCVTVAWNESSPLNCDPDAGDADCVRLEVVQ